MNHILLNWDKESWLSSPEYHHQILTFIQGNINIEEHYNILDLGCGRGLLLKQITKFYNLTNRPIGVDLVNAPPELQCFEFIHSDVLQYIQEQNIKFDIIILKQMLHMLSEKKQNELCLHLKRSLNKNGIIMYICMNKEHEIPTFPRFKFDLSEGLKNQNKLNKLLLENFSLLSINNFKYRVNIPKKEYINLIKNRFMSTLLPYSNNEIEIGINYIKLNYPDKLIFLDNLVFFFLANK